jgi:hypothetical protein
MGERAHPPLAGLCLLLLLSGCSDTGHQPGDTGGYDAADGAVADLATGVDWRRDQAIQQPDTALSDSPTPDGALPDAGPDGPTADAPWPDAPIDTWAIDLAVDQGVDAPPVDAPVTPDAPLAPDTPVIPDSPPPPDSPPMPDSAPSPDTVVYPSCASWGDWTCSVAGSGCVASCQTGPSSARSLYCNQGACTCTELPNPQPVPCSPVTPDLDGCQQCSLAFSQGCCMP